MTSKDNCPLPDPALVEIARSLARKLAREDHAKALDESRRIARASASKLDALVAAISDENRHAEIESKSAVGNEIPKP